MHPSAEVRQRLAAAVAAVVAAVVVATAVGAWARAYPLDEDRFADATATALEDPEVVDAVAAVVADQLVDVALSVSDPRQLLPWPLSSVGSGVEARVRDLAADQMGRVLGTGVAKRALVAAVREAHVEVVTLLRDRRSARGVLVLDETDAVRLDLTGVLALGADAVLGIDLPTVDLPWGIGSVVVYRAEAVDESGLALRSARWFQAGPLPWWAWAVIAPIGILAAWYLATDRRALLVVAGVALAVSAVGAHLYLRLVRRDIANLIADAAIRDAVRSIMAELARPAGIVLALLAATGAALATLTWATGRRQRS